MQVGDGRLYWEDTPNAECKFLLEVFNPARTVSSILVHLPVCDGEPLKDASTEPSVKAVEDVSGNSRNPGVSGGRDPTVARRMGPVDKSMVVILQY